MQVRWRADKIDWESGRVGEGETGRLGEWETGRRGEGETERPGDKKKRESRITSLMETMI